jgi:ABC-2 type transport system ATP-binding protein
MGDTDLEPAVTSNSEPSIVVDQIGKTYYPSPGWMRALVATQIREPVVALDDINFTVDPGEIVAVVGPNGAGKTTTFRILVGLTTPTEGRATVMGYDATRQSPSVRSHVGWMPGDDRSLLMRLNCAENLRFHGRLQGMRPKAIERQVKHTLELVGLGHAAKKSIFALSAGMRARMQLARALLHEPPVLILDEPTGAVDPVAAHQLLNLIIKIVEERKIAALLSSHRLEEIEALHSRMILLDRGTIRYDGDLQTMRSRLDRPCVEISFGDGGAARRAAKVLDSAHAGIASLTVEDETVRCILEHGTRQGTVLAELEHMVADIVAVDEVKRPLRELLAEIYGATTVRSEADIRRERRDERRREREARELQGSGRPRSRR